MTWLLVAMLLGSDGGLSDAGTPDAGEVSTPKRWTWTHATDAGFLTPDGVTDVVTMRVGEIAQVKLDLPIILMQCDETLVTLDATIDTLLLKAVKPGHTRCGFWYRKNGYPDRTMELTVSP